MKKSLLLAALFVMAQSSFGFVRHPLIRRTVSGGGPLPPGAKPTIKRCEIFADGVRLNHNFGGEPEIRVLPVLYSSSVKNKADINKLLAWASNAGYVESMGPTDFPTIRYQGLDASGSDYFLFHQSGPTILQTGDKSAEALVEFTDRNCDR